MRKPAEILAALRAKRIHLPALEETESKTYRYLIYEDAKCCAHGLIAFYPAEDLKACEFVEKLLVRGESNSVLVLGPEGCGKTAVVQAARRKCLSPDGHCVYNPVIVDMNAVKTIAKQLASNDCVKYGGEEISNASSLQDITGLLEKHNAKNKAAVIVIMEEFDVFTTTTYQRLLYSFLDMSQRGAVPVLLFGLSRRLDVVDLLEKRIRSRLSHIQLCPFGELSFENYCEAVKEYLMISEKSTKRGPDTKSWNRDVLACMECQEVRNTLAKLFRSSKTVGCLSTFLDVTIRRVFNSDDDLKAALLFAYNLMYSSTESAYLEGLSILELTILLGLANMEETHKDDQRINFKMLQKYLTAFIQKKCRYICQDKEQLTQAFERLRKLELIVSPGSTAAKDHVMAEFQPLVLQVEAHTLRTFLRHASVPVPVRQWAECIDL